MAKPNAAAPDPRKVLGVLAFSVIAVQLVAGGPWGLEESVREAGPGPVLAAMILLPLLFALPQALMTAELASLCVRACSGVRRWRLAARWCRAGPGPRPV